MKNASTPRRIYVHATHCHLSYGGVEFGSPRNRVTQIDPSFPVVVTGNPASDTITVSQRKPHRATTTETWYRKG